MARSQDGVTQAEISHAIIHDLWQCGHYLHNNTGGRGGRAPILCYIHTHGGEAGQQQLLDTFDIKSGTLSEVLTKIEAAGYIERFKDDDDKRRQLVRVTEKGRERAEELIRERKAFEEQAFACLDATERDTLLSLLDRVVAHWGDLA